MSTNILKEDFLQPTTLQEALNLIKFLTTTHKKEIDNLKESHAKQAAIIRKLEENRKKELDFLSKELSKYEINLGIKTKIINQQLAEKDDIIQQQLKTIEELNSRLKVQNEFSMPEIIIDSNSDSGVNENSPKIEESKIETKSTRKCSRRFGDPIGFLRRVDFSQMKYKSCNRDEKKKEEKKNNLEVPVVNRRFFSRQISNDRPSDDEKVVHDDSLLSDSTLEPTVVRPKKLNVNNHFSDDASDDSEEVFDRVMTRNSIRRSVKTNPKYKKINRNKSKGLEQVKINMVD
ncbi:uncharacterized protein LOC113516534 [Galleria mellonella]|uniref:Uncharacterized protein LOC113516534 n=1 Tax=Galleria mellonella TaxID=7137 RepID=A0A6J1WVG3_GALME|nr:uncharacterized protein LOC113516534 [Galleria mellonella]